MSEKPMTNEQWLRDWAGYHPPETRDKLRAVADELAAIEREVNEQKSRAGTSELLLHDCQKAHDETLARLSTATALLRRVVYYADNPMTGVNLQDIAADARAFVAAAEGWDGQPSCAEAYSV